MVLRHHTRAPGLRLEDPVPSDKARTQHAMREAWLW